MTKNLKKKVKKGRFGSQKWPIAPRTGDSIISFQQFLVHSKIRSCFYKEFFYNFAFESDDFWSSHI